MTHKHTCIDCGAVIEGEFDCEIGIDHDFAQCDDCAAKEDISTMITTIAAKLHVGESTIVALLSRNHDDDTIDAGSGITYSKGELTEKALRIMFGLNTDEYADEPLGLALLLRGKLTEAEAQLIDGVE